MRKMTPETLARSITRMKGGEYTYSRQQLADMVRKMHGRPEHPAPTRDTVRAVLQAGPRTVRQITDILGTYPEIVRFFLVKDPKVEPVPDTRPTLWRLAQ